MPLLEIGLAPTATCAIRVTSAPPLDANHLEAADVRQRTIASGLAAIVVRTAQSILSLGAAIVLARLLTPGDFGVFAMVLPLGVMAANLSSQCLQTAILQSRDLEDEDLSAFFWFAARVNLLVAGGMVVIGLALAQFYGEPRVRGIAAIWAVLLYAVTLTAFQEARLKRQLRFPTVLFVQFATLVIALTSAVVAAWRGAGYWSLPLQIFVMEVTRAIGILAVGGWWPRRPRPAQHGRVNDLRRAWFSLVGLRLATWVNDQPDLLAVGRMGGAPVLGAYDTARRWSWYPFEEPFFALTDVAVASLNRAQGDPPRFRRVVMRAILVMLTISMPAIAFVAAETTTVVVTLLGTKWLPAVPFLRLLCVAAFCGALSRVTTWIPLAQGQTRRLLRWSLYLQAPAIVLAVLAGRHWGASGVAAAIATTACVLVLPGIAYAVHGSAVSLGDVLRAAARPTLASLGAAATVVMVSAVLPEGRGMERLAAALALHVAVFAVLWLGMPGGIDDARACAGGLREFRPGTTPAERTHAGP